MGKTRSKTDAGLSSLEQVDQALCELAELDRRQKSAENTCNQGIARLKTECEKALQIPIKGVMTPIVDRRRQLEADIAAFATEHKAELFVEKRSCELNHGVIGFKMGRPRIEFVESDDEVPSLWVQTRDRICKVLLATLSSLRLGLGAHNTLIKVDVEPNRAVALAKIKAQEIKPEQLAKIGLRFVEASDTFYCEPAQATIQSQSAKEPAGILA